MRSSEQWSGRSRGPALGYAFVFFVLRVAGLRAAYLVVDVFVLPYFFLFARSARRASADWLERVLGPRGPLLRQLDCWRHLRAFAHSIVDRAMVVARGPSLFEFEREGAEHLDASYARGQGLVILSAHLGGRAMAGDSLRRIELNIVAYQNEAEGIRRAFERARSDAPPKVIALNEGAFAGVEVLKALRAGEAVAMLADRHRGGETVRLPFLGQEAEFPLGPFLLIALSGAPAVISFATRGPGRRVRVWVSPPQGGSKAPRDARVERARELAAWYVSALEREARAAPYQWFNFYDFWADLGHNGVSRPEGAPRR